MEETLRQHLSECAAAFEAATGTKPSVVSRRALQDSRYLERVIGGEGFTVRTFDRLVQYLSDNWPSEADDTWPTGVPRPPKTPIAANVDAAAQPEVAA
ncbi:hypothetical protein MKK70_21425 [Methylobacterium sp. E-041]|uniref:hypothetical protein n=1 Tax=Methylobacterium sp. E-041 TaxID=2836573 RepID=UPI001FBACF2B|nr:hypothetical protein [Methylobacterium sp. E-041]MCJ2107890.1 hypothetical protein [Methylobacterium sp. E-041]